ncbi:hypothetical protein DPMN_045388 [Dreissena polymorpha]|uniref:Uncharacterized protein n=1 Tax=Dreissena polymorpha TaxID=45954 RepID=A0A9D4HXB7_DREPO|nr:hypothetical protein DPMN_045388 [Dreissena polymorpha]
MSFTASTPNTAAKTKRTLSVLSTPEDQGEQKKNRIKSNSSCDFNYTFENMAETENFGNVTLDDNTIRAIKQTVQDAINNAISTQMQTMIETIITGVVDGLSKRIECLENENLKLKNENRILNDALDANEQYSRRNSLRIFGIPESEKSNESTDTIVMNLCKSLGADVSIGEIDRSHRTGKPGGGRPRPIIAKFIS